MTNAYRIKSGSGGYYSKLDSGGNLAVKPGSGFLIGSSEADAGDATGERHLYQQEINRQRNFRFGYDNILFAENFPGTALNPAQWFSQFTTMAASVQSGALILNSANTASAVNTYVNIVSWRPIPLLGTSSTYIQFRAKTFGANMYNKVMELGMGYVATLASMTEGVCFRWTNNGELRGVLSTAGYPNGPSPVESATPALPIPADDEYHFYLINVTWHTVEFWIDDALVSEIELPGSNVALEQSDVALNRSPHAFRGTAMGGPVFMRVNIPNLTNATPPGPIPRLHVAEVVAASSGEPYNKTPAEIAVSAWGGWSGTGISGMATLTQTALFTYTSDPTAITALSNTTLPTGPSNQTLGGVFALNANFTGGYGATDYVMFSYQVPAQANTTQQRNLYITDVKIDVVNTGAAVATTPTIMEWCLVTGSTAVSLATADGATTRAYRRIPLGSHILPLGAAIGYAPQPVAVTLQCPAMCPVGRYVGVLVKLPIGTATASQVIRGHVMLNGYWY